MKHWFLPETPDLLGALRAHVEVTGEGIDSFLAWARGDEAAGRAVSDHEHRADDAKRKVLAGLRVAFSTPLDAEDIYSLAERIDAVMNAAKNIVREAEVMAMRPDSHMAAMAEQVSLGQSDLVAAIGALTSDDQLATDASDAAVRRCRELERLYRVAMSELLVDQDLGEVMGRRELYRRFSRAAEAIEAVSERVWYAVVKSV